MADLITCLKTSVGLSPNDCSCLQDSRPTDYNASGSGYFLDDFEIAPPLKFPEAALDSCLEFWATLERARDEGIRDFITDLLISSKDNTTLKMTPFDGAFVDDEKISAVLTGMSNQFLVSKYEPKEYVRGAVLEVKEVGLVMNTAQAYTLNIYSDKDLSTPVANGTIPITVTTPGTIAKAKPNDGTNDIVLKLPMWSDDRKQSYYFIYDRLGARPYNLKYNCGCSGARRKWEIHLAGIGKATDDITTLNTNYGKKVYSQGVYVYGSLTCDGFDWLCRDWNYQSDSFARVMARLIQLYSIRKLVSLILNSGRVNFYTLLNSKSLVARQIVITKMIQDPVQGNMPWLIRNIPRDVTGCWECESKFKQSTL